MTAHPSETERKLAALKKRPFAHRGLHAAGAAPENSLAAFDAAIGKGLGIELDVQATSDGDAVVFHDADLDRLTDQTGPVARRSARELKTVVLNGSKERICRLHDALLHIGGRVPVLIEVKSNDRQAQGLCLAIRRALEGYRGPVAVMSFNPDVSRWFSEHAPSVPHGLVLSEEDDAARPRVRNNPIARLIAIMVARPVFLAYDLRSLPSRTAKRARRRGMPVFTWTVRSEEDLVKALEHADQCIAEGRAAELLAKRDGAG